MSNSNVKSQILSKVATLLDKFSDRLVKIAAETKQNTEAIAELKDRALDAHARVDAINSLRKGTDAKVQEIATRIQQDFSRVTTLADRIKEVEFENNKREESQTLRDQNNVQSLVNLRESTQKAFSQVRDDVAQLMRQIQVLNERVGKVESQNLILAESQRVNLLSTTQSSINFKLSGVYDVTAELDKRLQVVEARVKELPDRPAVTYLGHSVSYYKNILTVGGQDFFPLQQNIVKLAAEPYGVIILLENGEQHILYGGPSVQSMVVLLFKTKP